MNDLGKAVVAVVVLLRWSTTGVMPRSESRQRQRSRTTDGVAAAPYLDKRRDERRRGGIV